MIDVGNNEPILTGRFEVSNKKSKKSSSLKSDDSDKLAQDDDEDMNNVRLTMQSFLDDSMESFLFKPHIKVKFSKLILI